MGGGGTKVSIPPPPATPPELLEQVRMQTDLMRLLMPSQEDIASQRAMSKRMSDYIAQFEPFLTPEEVRAREAEQVSLMTGDIGEMRQTAIRDAIERSNRYGINPALTIGQIERESGRLTQQVKAGDALQRAIALSQLPGMGLQQQMQQMGMASELATSPYFRVSGPAGQSVSNLANFQQQQWQQQLQLANAQAQLAQMSGGGGFGKAMPGIGSLVGAGIGGALGGLPGAALGLGIGGAAGGAAGGFWSSKQFKDDIKPLGEQGERKALADILRSQPVSFRYKGDSEVRPGIIAEEAPEAFVTRDRMGMDVGKTLGTILAGMKAEHREMESVKERLEEVSHA